MRKGKQQVTLLIALLAAGIIPPGLAFAEESGSVLPDVEVTGENQFRLDVEKTTLRYQPSAENLDGGQTGIEELIFDYNRLAQAPAPSRGGLHTPLLPSFAARPPHSAPMATFRTSFATGSDLESWTLEITDYRGEVFRSIRGKGQPPAEIEWDGRGQDDEVIKPGFPYSYFFRVEDSGTNSYRYDGRPFEIPWLAYSEARRLHFDTAASVFFEEGRAKLLPDWERELERFAREILAHPDRALSVEVKAKNAELAGERAELLARRLEERLLLEPGQILREASTWVGNPPARDGLVRFMVLDEKETAKG